VDDEVQWSGQTVAAGQSLTVTFAVTVAGTLDDGTILTNAEYGVSSAAGASAVGEPVTTTVQAFAPVLSIGKSESEDPVLAGELLTYTLVVNNRGAVDATGVMVTDTLPAETAFAWADTEGVLVDDEVQWSGQTVAAGQSLTVTFAVTVAGTLGDGTILTNAEYGVSSAAGASAVGEPVTTTVTTDRYGIYLPVVLRTYHSESSP
jgi:uncharacterized repeat protein (TIGR01451 family)